MHYEENTFYFMTGTKSGTVLLFNISKKDPLRKVMNAHYGEINCIVTSSSRKFFLTSSSKYDNSIKIWSRQSFKCLYKIYEGIPGNFILKGEFVKKLIIIPKTNEFLSLSDEKNIKFYKARTKQLTYQQNIDSNDDNQVETFTLTPDSKHILFGLNSYMLLYDIEEKEEVWKIKCKMQKKFE